jgi:hypothetical protein
MTDNDFAQLAALRTQNTAAALRAVGFQVLSVRPATFGWRVNLSIIPKTEKTIHDRVTKAGYSLRRHGTDDDGLFMIVE